ncbi:ATP-dependent helicase, partial [Pseudomonas sp. MWU13-2625]
RPTRQREGGRGDERGGGRNGGGGAERGAGRGGERGGRRDRDGHRGASGRRPGGSGRGHHRRHEAPVDDFFLKPYEPSASAKQHDDAQPAQQPEKKGPKRQVAALLGGFGMPRKPSV